MELFNNNRALSNSLDETEKENYNHFAILLNLVGKLLSKGCTISKLYNLYDVHLIDEGGKFPAKSILKRNIDRISKYFREDIPKSAEEIEICNILDKVIKKYNLNDVNQLNNKINELMTKEDIINQLINNINTAYNCQRVDINSLSTFVSELVNNMANYTAMQNNSSQMFINLNNTLNENAILKTENEQLKRQLANINMNNFGQTY